jgi:transcriptional regulator with XRE-family HTH domain
MYEQEPARLLELLAELVARSGRTQREVERALGVGHGWLRLLFAGKSELKVRHILDLAALLGFTPGQFFRQAYPEVQGTAVEQVRRNVNDILPPKLRRRQLNSQARLEVRDIFREELGKLGLVPRERGAPEPPLPEEPEED